jgi:hypothetical protein
MNLFIYVSNPAVQFTVSFAVNASKFFKNFLDLKTELFNHSNSFYLKYLDTRRMNNIG